MGTGRAAIVAAALELLRDDAAYRAMARAVNPYGDGRAAARTVAAMSHYFGLGPPPGEFAPTEAWPGSASRSTHAVKVTD